MLLSVLIIISINYVLCVDKCCTEDSHQQFHSLFTVNGRALENDLLLWKIKPCSNASTACFIEEDELFGSQTNKGYLRNLIIKFKCPTNAMTVHLVPGSVVPIPDAISYVEIEQCRMFMDDFERLTKLVDVKVLTFIGQADLVQNTSKDACSSFSQLGSLSVLQKGVTSINIYRLMECDVHNVVESILQNMSLSSIDQFQKRMPNLQSLDLAYNNFSKPPFFPWNNHTMNLPRTISRNSMFQSHYTFFNALDIPPNVYIRQFKLSYNTNLNLTGFQFHGWIDKLSLTKCKLQELSPGLFSNVFHLQFLELDGNELNSLPSEIFLSLSHLKNLRLQENNLSTFHDDTFSSLHELVSLNLGSNRIVSLLPGLFRGLKKLKRLYLENNNIQYINQSVFQGIRTHLKELHLQNNPLLQFPEVLFLLRGLQRAFLTNTSITEIDFVKIESDVKWSDLVFSLSDSLSTGTTNLDDVKGEPRVIDMSGSQVKSIAFSAKVYHSYWRLSLILKHFKIVLNSNPITCDCNILNLTNAVEGLRDNNTLTGREYMLSGWICSYPKELEGRMLFSLAPRETYCEVNLDGCPLECKCYRRSVIGTIIVDCRQMGLITTPNHLPPGKLELWLQGNAIEVFDAGVHNKDVVSLMLSRNAVHQFQHHVLADMVSLRTLYLDDNLLASIPLVIRTLKLTRLKLGGNPLKCDCHALWMKIWIITNNKIIQDTDNIKCINSVSGEGIRVSLVPDEDFVCDIPLHAIALLIALPTCFILLLLILCLILFVIWQDFKVWLFVHMGLHPFDKKDILQNSKYDVFVFYLPALVDWVQFHVTDPLEVIHGLKVFDMHRDSRLGISFQGNISHAVDSSKRIIYVVTNSSDVDAIAKTTLDTSLTKCRDQKANFLIPLIHQCSPKKITNKSLQKYIKAKRYVNTQEKNFLKRVLYYLPPTQKSSCKTMSPKVSTPVSFTNSNVNSNQNGSPVSSNSIQLSVSNDELCPLTSIFVWYSDSDFPFTMENIVIPYERMGYNCILADKNFVPGAAIQENILDAVHNSFRTVIVLSEASAHDEWLLFLFRFAYERQLKQKNYLVGLVVVKGSEPDVMDDEVAKQLESFVSVHECDRWFHKKLKTFLISTDVETQSNHVVFNVNIDPNTD